MKKTTILCITIVGLISLVTVLIMGDVGSHIVSTISDSDI